MWLRLFPFILDIDLPRLSGGKTKLGGTGQRGATKMFLIAVNPGGEMFYVTSIKAGKKYLSSRLLPGEQIVYAGSRPVSRRTLVTRFVRVARGVYVRA